MAYIEVKEVTKKYVQRQGSCESFVTALDSVSFSCDKGEFITIYGPNGSGKTTLLNCLCGIVKVDSGGITIAEMDAAAARTSFVFQDYRNSLLPWRKVIDNIAFPLELRGMRKKQRRGAAATLVSKCGIELELGAYPYQLSGGQQQMVSILRGMIEDPAVILMDEPFSALDFETRLSMQNGLLDLWRKTGSTIVFVSHDIEEAMYLADRVLLLGHQPSRIIDSVRMGTYFGRPRSRGMVESTKFMHIKARLLGKLWGERR